MRDDAELQRTTMGWKVTVSVTVTQPNAAEAKFADPKPKVDLTPLDNALAICMQGRHCFEWTGHILHQRLNYHSGSVICFQDLLDETDDGIAPSWLIYPRC